MIDEEAIQRELGTTIAGAETSKRITERDLARKIEEGKPFSELEIHTYLYTQVELELVAWIKEALDPRIAPSETLRYVHEKATQAVMYRSPNPPLTIIGIALRDNRRDHLTQFVQNTARLLEEEEGA